jgi:hypothetical protein
VTDDVLVFVGVIGAGKTSVAKMLDREFISFDQVWHRQGDRGLDLSRHDIVEHFGDLIMVAPRPVVLDGWWTWVQEWWKIHNDQTLDRLQSYTCATIRVAHLVLSEQQAYDEWLKKRLVISHGKHPGHNACRTYRASIAPRQKYLSAKVNEWAT